MHEAKTQLSMLAARAARSEEIVIARHGIPLAKLGPLEGPCRELKFGSWKGKMWMSDDFDVPLPPEIQRYFDGKGD